MNTIESDLPSEKILEFFLHTMWTASWFSEGGVRETVGGMPGFTAISYSKGDLHLCDQFSIDGENTFGWTIIWYKGRPVWRMDYGGWYSPSVVQFLINTLKVTYKEGVFVGGRGPQDTLVDKFRYMNCPIKNDFGCFEGQEQIRHIDGTLKGFHTYSGGWIPKV